MKFSVSNMDNDIRNILSGSDLCVPVYMHRHVRPFLDFIYVYVCIYIHIHMYMYEDF